MGKMKYADDPAPEPGDAEAEYKRILPELLQMLAEWQKIRGPAGCPVFRELTKPE